MRNKKLRLYTYLGAIFVATYASIPAYINSSFLKNFLGERGVGWLYAIISLITIFLMFGAPRLINRLGDKKTLLLFASLSFLSIIPLSFPSLKTIPLLVAFSFYIILGYLTRYALDVYLENISIDQETGFIRGLYLTFFNFSWLISPMIAAYLLTLGGYRSVYGVAGLTLIPFCLIVFFKLKENKLVKNLDSTVRSEIKYLWSSQTRTAKNIKDILAIDFLLNFFYAIMVVYMPLYLHDHVGLAWTEIGLIFTIMLTPFVFLGLPLGKIADRWSGEKEILIGGLIVIVLSTMAITFLKTTDWLPWAIILFLTRIGAATIEIMKESYLFKKIDGVNTGIISLSRINVPLSYLIGPIFATAMLFLFPMQNMFLGLGLILIIGLKFAWALDDTK